MLDLFIIGLISMCILLTLQIIPYLLPIIVTIGELLGGKKRMFTDKKWKELATAIGIDEKKEIAKLIASIPFLAHGREPERMALSALAIYKYAIDNPK